jgi:hypothetical protein
MTADLISVKPTKVYEDSHKVDFWINFFIADLGNFRTTQLLIANQMATRNLKMLTAIYFAQHTSNTRCVSIAQPSMITSDMLPPLIETNVLFSIPEPKHIVCYSVSGEDFPRTLKYIANKHPDYTFDYFLNYIHSYSYCTPPNVRVHKTSKNAFQEHRCRAAGVLCTSGHELLQECVFLGIPVALMPCSGAQEEQVENFEYYTTKGWCVEMNEELDINNLIESDVSEQQEDITKLIDGREEKVIRLIEGC